MQSWMTAFSGFSVKTTNRLVTEDSVAAVLVFSGTNDGSMQMSPDAPEIPATGKRLEGAKGSYLSRVRDGKIVGFNSYPDLAGMMMQLGSMPGPEA